MVRVSGWRWVWGVVVFCAAMATASRAQTFTTLASFDGPNGNFPFFMTLIQGSDGDLYGATEFGGIEDKGVLFKFNLGGELNRLHSFCTLAHCTDGSWPQSPLVQGSNGEYYGTTLTGGSSPEECGTVFEITAERKLTTLHYFERSDGCQPAAGLMQAANGNFYGTTISGGMYNSGTIFEISAAGRFTSLYSFCSLPNCADGKFPESSLVQGADGYLYGVASAGGNAHNCPVPQFQSGCGTAFKINSAGQLKKLSSFCSLANCADGAIPVSLIEAKDGDLYGTTFQGGAGCGPSGGCGTIFKITPEGELTSLHNSFCSLPNCADGAFPVSLMQATDGNFYGTTSAGGSGSGNSGTIFEITPAGTLTILYSFCSSANCLDGALPYGGLIQAANGIFYGTTELGGASNDGTIFSLDSGLSPFVSFIRNPAKVGQQFGILGYGLTGTSSVSLNGIPASFKAHSDTLLVATVPTGATTGYVTVTTPGGTLTSNVPFHVLP